jgi:hypothetical protein
LLQKVKEENQGSTPLPGFRKNFELNQIVEETKSPKKAPSLD